MISILIPIYNRNITRLVNDTNRQATALGIDFEIVAVEDGSSKYLSENLSIADINSVEYWVEKKNLGRASIRNLLANRAKYQILLFLDCDTELCSDSFIKKYLEVFENKTAVVGGTVYKTTKNPDFALNYKYGTEREQLTAKNIDNRKKYGVFNSSNFLIDKQIFNCVKFDENIKGYGHEDTVFGIELSRNGFTIKYIDNPVIHRGISNNYEYLKKIEISTQKLVIIYKSNSYLELNGVSKIIKVFLRLKKWGLSRVFASIFGITKPLITKNLLSKTPSLLVLDIFKLGTFCKEYYA